jgi:ABC-type transport system substrate-binding protein
VNWSWNHAFSPESLTYSKSTTGQAQAKITKKIEQTGPNQVSVTLSTVYTGLPVGLMSEAGPNAIPAILQKRAALHDEAVEQAYDKKPNGAGPLKLVRHVPAEVMEFERFEDFYYQPKNGLPEDRRVKFKSLALRLVPEEATRVAAIRAGEADIAPISISNKKQLESGGGRVIFGP